MIIKAPNSFQPIEEDSKLLDKYSIFLAGSIEMGKAEDWQTILSNEIDHESTLILNPRRDNWDPTWKQEIGNPQFKEQVEWELDAQDYADLILMYFDPNTKSPITLLELGIYKDKHLIVCCPEGFYRKGNVDIVCKRYGINQVDTLRDLSAYAYKFRK